MMDAALEELCLELSDAVAAAADARHEDRAGALGDLRLLLDRAAELRQRRGNHPADLRRLLSMVLAAEDAWVSLEKKIQRG